MAIIPLHLFKSGWPPQFIKWLRFIEIVMKLNIHGIIVKYDWGNETFRGFSNYLCFFLSPDEPVVNIRGAWRYNCSGSGCWLASFWPVTSKINFDRNCLDWYNHFFKGYFSQHLRWAQYSRFAIFTLVLQRASKHTPISASIAVNERGTRDSTCRLCRM